MFFYLLIGLFPLIISGLDKNVHYEVALKKLSTPNSFAFCDLGLTDTELELFKQMTINKCDNYDQFGSIEQLSKELPLFLEKAGANPQLTVQASTVICKITNNVLVAQNAQTAWVALRTYTPNDLFNVPRWHVDGNYYEPYNSNLPKFAVTLKGDSTLFYNATDGERKDVMSFSADEERVFLSSRLDTNKIKVPTLGVGTFFIVGDSMRAAVHSEPQIKQERLFLSMVCGSNEQIAELKTRWGR